MKHIKEYIVAATAIVLALWAINTFSIDGVSPTLQGYLEHSVASVSALNDLQDDYYIAHYRMCDGRFISHFAAVLEVDGERVVKRGWLVGHSTPDEFWTLLKANYPDLLDVMSGEGKGGRVDQPCPRDMSA